MSEPHGIGTKIKRLFLEQEEGKAPAGPADEPAARPPSPAPVPARKGPESPVEPAKLDFPGIFRTAGHSDEDLAQVVHAEQLLRTLPANLPLETQKQIL